MKSSLKTFCGIIIMITVLAIFVIMLREEKLSLGNYLRPIFNKTAAIITKGVVRTKPLRILAPPAVDRSVPLQEKKSSSNPAKTDRARNLRPDLEGKTGAATFVTIKMISNDTEAESNPAVAALETDDRAEPGKLERKIAELASKSPLMPVAAPNALQGATPTLYAPTDFNFQYNPEIAVSETPSAITQEAPDPDLTGNIPVIESETFLDRLKVACDFQSLGVGYKVFEVKKIAFDVLAYTDKAGVGLSYKFNNNLHLGIDGTMKYHNGEQQIRVYVSVPVGGTK